RSRGLGDVYKRQQLGAVGGFDQKAQAIALGEQAARAALPKIKAELAKYR
ncbi:patatin-like phospholipase family protein, partial [Kingella kingae]|nr:patatin-like phospholipase family protein [Kingella kingae]